MPRMKLKREKVSEVWETLKEDTHIRGE